MNTHTERHDERDHARPVTSRLHPRVYAMVLDLTLWLVASVWLFAGGGLTDYLLFIVSGFIFVVVALQLILSRVGRDPAGDGERPMAFRDWAAADFETAQGRCSGAQATLLILLPIAAAALGMTAFGIALPVAEGGLAQPQPLTVYSSGSAAGKSG